MNAFKEPVSSYTYGGSPEAVELFTGCGGLALGMSMAGIHHRLMVEFNSQATETIRFNAAKDIDHVRKWPLIQDDVRNVDWTQYRGVKIVAGGPPCQPFSVGGKAQGDRDSRDMWPEAIRAVREIEPDLFLFENVRGLLRPSFSSYVEWIRRYLANPRIVPGVNESLAAHLRRLRREDSGAEYDVSIFPVNAADYGAPQKRHRVFFVGVRRPQGVSPKTPPKTHCHARLVWDKWISEEYWDRHEIPRRKRPAISPIETRIVQDLRSEMFEPVGSAWQTCRDAFRGLGQPTKNDDGRNHRLQLGARSYPGHTGSPFDEPAKALKAGVHGVPGGENMLLLDSGEVRYFTIREAARLQGLPDEYAFPGSWTESMRQIGNAVPTMLASHIAEWVLSLAQTPGPTLT